MISKMFNIYDTKFSYKPYKIGIIIIIRDNNTCYNPTVAFTPWMGRENQKQIRKLQQARVLKVKLIARQLLCLPHPSCGILWHLHPVLAWYLRMLRRFLIRHFTTNLMMENWKLENWAIFLRV